MDENIIVFPKGEEEKLKFEEVPETTLDKWKPPEVAGIEELTALRIIMYGEEVANNG